MALLFSFLRQSGAYEAFLYWRAAHNFQYDDSP
jgi:hypothetical protein